MTNTGIAVMQILLNKTGEHLQVDGKTGPHTDAALARHPEVARQKVAVEHLVATIPDSIQAKELWIEKQDVDKLVRSAASIFHVPESDLQFILQHETIKKVVNGHLCYKADAIAPTGRHRGLGQLSRAAWTDAQRIASAHGVVLKDYDRSWMNPAQSILAMAAYSKATVEYANSILRKSGRPFLTVTPEIRYALYNQGPAFVKNVLTGRRGLLGTQSNEANATIAVARKQMLGSATV
jgi:hypothetical protein